MVIARIESLILDKGLEDAISRAKAYINAGADAILIHSKSNKPNVFLSSQKFTKFWKKSSAFLCSYKL